MYKIKTYLHTSYIPFSLKSLYSENSYIIQAQTDDNLIQSSHIISAFYNDLPQTLLMSQVTMTVGSAQGLP